MHQDSLSFPQLSQEQKQVAFNADPFCQFLPKTTLASNLPLQKAANQKNQVQREEVAIKTGKKGRRSNQQLQNARRGHWSTQQNKKYHWFLQIHYRHFVNRHMRRTDKIFKTMQIFIGTRQAEQCRSHHQKMQKKQMNFISIISNLRQIHYASKDTNQLQQEIENFGIEIPQKLATLEQMKTWKKQGDELEPLVPKKSSHLKPPKQQKQTDKECIMGENGVDNVDEYKERENEENAEHVNMFEDSRNNIGDLVMYHEREDISCIFQSIFQPPQ